MPTRLGWIREPLAARGIVGPPAEVPAQVRHAIWSVERHTWYEMRLGERHARSRLEAPFRLVRPTRPEDFEVLHVLERGPRLARALARRGHELYVVLDGDTPAFSCWIHRGSAPTLAARGGWFPLPDGTVCVEDMVTGAPYRGNGLAGRAWSAVSASLHRDGVTSVITKIAWDNASSRRAADKGGNFFPVASMTATRRGPLTRVRVEPVGDAPAGRMLRQVLERGVPRRAQLTTSARAPRALGPGRTVPPAPRRRPTA